MQKKTLKENLIIISLVAPALLLFFLAVFVPIVVSVYYGLTDMEGMNQASFIGLANYKEILTNDPIFWTSLRNALILGLGYILLQHPFCILFAIVLDKLGGAAEKIFRVLFFTPCVISIVITSSLWVNIYNPDYGLLNKLLDALHLGFLKQQWLGDPKTAFWCLLVILLWQGFGMGLLIYYAGVKGIPGELYEAAQIDGAYGLRIYISITIPLLTPVARIAITLGMVNALKQMETVFLTTGGGPGNATQFLANYLYIKAFNSFQYGYANAISVLFVIVCLIVTVLFQKLLKKDVGEF